MRKSIKEYEENAFRSFWNDGLLDLMLGLVILVVGISWWQDVAAMGAVFPAVCASLWYPLRKRLVEPRMGFVEFSGERDLKVRSFRFGLVAFFTGTMMLGAVIYVLYNGDVISHPAEWIAGFPLVLVGIPVLFFAVFTRCQRFGIYAVFLLLAGVEVVFQGWDPHVGLIASGVFITLAGLYILLKFMSRHPAEPPQPQ